MFSQHRGVLMSLGPETESVLVDAPATRRQTVELEQLQN